MKHYDIEYLKEGKATIQRYVDIEEVYKLKAQYTVLIIRAY